MNNYAVDFIEKNVDQVPIFSGDKPIRFAPRKIDVRTAEERYDEAKQTREIIFYQNQLKNTAMLQLNDFLKESRHLYTTQIKARIRRRTQITKWISIALTL